MSEYLEEAKEGMKVALIPAREGSTRLKHKNLRLLHGKPLVEWSIIAAIESELFDEIIVSTDWMELIEELEDNYLNVLFCERPPELATKEALMQDVIKFHLQEYNDSEFCLLQPTSPLRRGNDIVVTHNCFTKAFNSLFTVNQNTYKPNGCIYWFRDPNDTFKAPSYIYFQHEGVSVDIDDITDFRVAEYLMEKRGRLERRRVRER